MSSRRSGWTLVVPLLMSLALAVGTATRVEPQQMEDVIYLKDGSIIRGTIVEQRPGESILIRTRDGNQFRYTMAQIDRMTKEAAPAPQGRVTGRKSPALAFLLSFLITGAGQGYNGEWGKAGIMFGGVVVSYAVAVGGADACTFDDNCAQFGIGVLGIVGFALWSMIDAPISASAINRRVGGTASIEVGPRLQLGLSSRQASPHRFGSGLAPGRADSRVGLSLVRVRF
ncbi:MAG: hypothetical protein HY560_07950 [Gemmatimonadetes bacterium]|nr:hypothetical protein [Gemmatimonadota bacterium]